MLNVDDGTLFNGSVQLDGAPQTVRVPVGTYSVVGNIVESDAEGSVTGLSTVVEPEIEVTADTTVVLDARETEPVTVTTERPKELESVTVGAHRTDGPYVWLNGRSTTVPGAAGVYATPTEPVTEGGLDFTAGFSLAAPTTNGQPPAYTYDLLYVRDGIDTVEFTATSENTATVDVG